jgi:hypothetical protein
MGYHTEEKLTDNEIINHGKNKFLAKIGKEQFDVNFAYNIHTDIVEQQQEHDEENSDNKALTLVSIKGR